MCIIILLKTGIYFYFNSYSVIRIQFQYKTLHYIWKFNIFVLNLMYLYIK